MSITFRGAASGDLPLLIALRLAYLADTGAFPEASDTFRQTLSAYYQSHLADGTFYALIAEDNGVPVSAAFLVFCEKPPGAAFPTGQVATLMNVFTYPDYRRRGLAAAVVTQLLAYASRRGVSMVELSATEAGRPLYEKLGFTTSRHTHMSKLLSF